MSEEWPPFRQVTRYEQRGLNSRPWTSVLDSRPSHRVTPRRTGWSDEPAPGEVQQAPNSLFSTLGVPPLPQHAYYKGNIQFLEWKGPGHGWGANLLPACHKLHLTSDLGTKTSRPISAYEKSNHLSWKSASRREAKTFRPKSFNPIHGCLPDEVTPKLNLWSTSSSAAFNGNMWDSGPAFGEMSSATKRQTRAFATLGVHPTVP